jgi:hypothetical protein
MGIECRLRRVETADRARGDAQRAMAEGGRAAAVELTGRLDGGCELCVAGSKRRGARAELVAVEARSRVERQGRMVFSGRVEACEANRQAGAGRLNSGKTRDDMKRAAFALRARSAERRLLLFCQQRAWIRCGGAEMKSAEGERLTAVAVGEQSEVADLDEARRQDMEQETADELDRIELHDAAAVVVPGIAPSEAHLSVFEAEESSVGDGNPVRIAGQVLQHMFGSSERRLGVDHPFSQAHVPKQSVKCAWCR